MNVYIRNEYGYNKHIAISDTERPEIVQCSQVLKSETTSSMFLFMGKFSEVGVETVKVTSCKGIFIYIYIYFCLFICKGIKARDQKSVFSCFGARNLVIGF